MAYLFRCTKQANYEEFLSTIRHFVEVWNRFDTTEQVAQYFGKDRRFVQNYASKLRQKGIKLKCYPVGGPGIRGEIGLTALDVDRLKIFSDTGVWPERPNPIKYKAVPTPEEVAEAVAKAVAEAAQEQTEYEKRQQEFAATAERIKKRYRS